jgi:atypical dual specificity phosphatase
LEDFAMGLSLSVSPNSSGRLNAVTLLAYESGQFAAVSVVDFVRNLASFRSRPLAILEPIQRSSVTADVVTRDKFEFVNVKTALRRDFSFKSVQTPRCRLWLHVPIASEFSAFLLAIKKVPFATFCSSSVISPSSLFTDFPGFTTVFQALSQPPKNPVSYRVNLSPSLPELPPSTENDYDLIFPNVYVGNESAMMDLDFLRQKQVTHIVSFGTGAETPSKSLSPTGIRTFLVKLDDSAFETFDKDFWEALTFVKNSLDAGGIVLIHCRKGISRSPALCIAYLMEENGYSFQDALNLVKSRRPTISLNPGFVEQLKMRESQGRSMTRSPRCIST